MVNEFDATVIGQQDFRWVLCEQLLVSTTAGGVDHRKINLHSSLYQQALLIE